MPRELSFSSAAPAAPLHCRCVRLQKAPSTATKYSFTGTLQDASAPATSPVKPLKVVLAPQRQRTVIGFEDRMGEPNPLKPTLTVFEHINGARVYR
jgi:hypothetical protein